eukprot:7380311-Prymnesium_polylepis.1
MPSAPRSLSRRQMATCSLLDPIAAMCRGVRALESASKALTPKSRSISTSGRQPFAAASRSTSPAPSAPAASTCFGIAVTAG